VIQLIVTKNCPECESDNIIKNGKDYKGDQKFHGQACGLIRNVLVCEALIASVRSLPLANITPSARRAARRLTSSAGT
jgi:transposase-like protein